MYFSKLESQWGELIASWNNIGELRGLWFKGQKHFPLIPKEAQWIDDINNCNIAKVEIARKELIKQMRQYEMGVLKTFKLPINLEGTPFRKQVWQSLLIIPYGETITYGEIAKSVAQAMGKQSMSGQAIGGAVGHNPISIIIPCHRVIAQTGALTGYAAGLPTKESLLIHEKQFKESPKILNGMF